MVWASGSETSISSSTPTSAIIYDAYTSIIKKLKIKKIKFDCCIAKRISYRFLLDFLVVFRQMRARTGRDQSKQNNCL